MHSSAIPGPVPMATAISAPPHVTKLLLLADVCAPPINRSEHRLSPELCRPETPACNPVREE